MSVVQCAPSSDAHRGSANANAGADAGAGAGPSVEGLAPTASAQSAWATVADAAVVRGEAIDALALSLEARVAGAFVGPVSDQTTLVAVFCGSANQGTVPADALLSAVATQCGGLASLRTLSQRLASGEIVLARGDAVLRAVRGLVRGGQGKAGKGGPGVHRLPGALVGAVMEAVSEGDCLVEVSWEGRSWRCSAGREGLESVERWPWGKHGVDAPGTAAAVPALGGSVEPEEADGVGGVPDERGGASGAGAGVRDERGGASKGGVGVSEVWGLAGTGGASGSGVTATGRGGESKQGELQRMGLPIWNWPESGAGASGSGATETGCGGESGQGEVRQEVPRPSKRRLPGALSGDNGHALGAFLDLGEGCDDGPRGTWTRRCMANDADSISRLLCTGGRHSHAQARCSRDASCPVPLQVPPPSESSGRWCHQAPPPRRASTRGPPRPATCEMRASSQQRRSTRGQGTPSRRLRQTSHTA